MRGAGQRAARIRGWPVFELPAWLRSYVMAVIAVGAAAIAAAAADLTPQRTDLAIFAVLLACDVATVEIARRAGEAGGLSKDVNAIWELPIACLLPVFYGLVAPLVRIAITQWRVRHTVLYRRIFTMCALALSYGAASLVFHALAPLSAGPAVFTDARVQNWALLVILCGVLRSLANKLLVMTAVKGADPSTSIRTALLTPAALFHDLAELSVGVLVAVAYVVSTSPLMALCALPCAALLQRSQRTLQLLSKARIDGKTGLLNADTWQREAALQVARARRGHHAAPLAVAIADLDYFKAVNDTWGHPAGDAALAAVAMTLKAQVRDGDLCGRFGLGDEFAILLIDIPGDQAADIAQRLCEAVRKLSFPVPDEESVLAGAAPRLTISVGVAGSDAVDGGLDELLRAADSALYAAKRAGRDRVSVIGG